MFFFFVSVCKRKSHFIRRGGCVCFLSNLYVVNMPVVYLKNGFCSLSNEGSMEWVSLLMEHRASAAFRSCVSTSGLLLGPIVNLTALRLHLFRFVLWL